MTGTINTLPAPSALAYDSLSKENRRALYAQTCERVAALIEQLNRVVALAVDAGIPTDEIADALLGNDG